MAATERDHGAGANVIRFPTPGPAAQIPRHLQTPMSNAERRHTAARGIPRASRPLPADGSGRSTPMVERPDRFEWERAVRRSDLHPTTRLVLFALGTFMHRDGTGARPTQQTLADSCGLTVRAVRTHLATARHDGWIERTRQGRGVGRDGGMSSEYEARLPATSGGTPLPPEEDSAGTSVPPEPESQPERDASQPESHDVSAGTTVPPIKGDQACTPSSSSAGVPDDIKIAARAQIRQKRDRGEAIHNEHGLLLTICRQLIEARDLDAAVDAQASSRHVDEWAARLASMTALGERRAQTFDGDGPLTEQQLLAELADELRQDLVDAAVARFRQERSRHERLRTEGATP